MSTAGQLLRDGRRTTSVVAEHGVLGGGKKTDGIDAEMLVETFVLSVDERLEKGWIHLIVLHRRTVFVEILSNQYSVG